MNYAAAAASLRVVRRDQEPAERTDGRGGARVDEQAGQPARASSAHPLSLGFLASRPTSTFEVNDRFVLTSLLASMPASTLPEDVRHGLTRTPKVLPPKYFYDEHGARLFDAICTTAEYYPTRTEAALLDRFASEIIEHTRPSALLELGSGAARKTRILLDRITQEIARPWYVPVDISEAMLRSSAEALLRDYPSLRVHGVVADYDHHLHHLPGGERASGPGNGNGNGDGQSGDPGAGAGRRLIAFLGSTIGNFAQPHAIEFLASLRRGMSAADRLLLGLDLVKSPAVLHAAYNDQQGFTAEFNRNVLRVINRELDASFDADAFEHIARYLPEQEQVEMSLRARRSQTVRIGRLGLAVEFARGERLRTEISRKFTQSSAAAMIGGAGLVIDRWYESGDHYFALAIARIP